MIHFKVTWAADSIGNNDDNNDDNDSNWRRTKNDCVVSFALERNEPKLIHNHFRWCATRIACVETIAACVLNRKCCFKGYLRQREISPSFITNECGNWGSFGWVFYAIRSCIREHWLVMSKYCNKVRDEAVTLVVTRTGDVCWSWRFAWKAWNGNNHLIWDEGAMMASLMVLWIQNLAISHAVVILNSRILV